MQIELDNLNIKVEGLQLICLDFDGSWFRYRPTACSEL